MVGVIKGGGILKVSLALPPTIKILFIHIQEQIHGRPIYWRVSLTLGGDAMQGSWVSPSRDDECMDNKIYSDNFIEKYLA